MSGKGKPKDQNVRYNVDYPLSELLKKIQDRHEDHQHM